MKPISLKAIFVAVSLLLSVFTFGIASASPTDNTPTAVKTAFLKAYPNISKMKWEMEKGDYEAHFRNGTEVTVVTYSPKGVLLSTETEINIDKVPDPVLNAAGKLHRNGQAKKYFKIVRPNGVVVYKTVENGNDIMITPEGQETK